METATEAELFGPKPGNAGERLAADWRLLLVIGTGLVIQVSHPVIGAGVGAHSTYRTDPYGRAKRSVWPVLAMVMLEDGGYGADLRAMHRGIGGVDHQGRSYHAWNAEAAFLVTASAAYASEQLAARFGTPLTEGERREVFHAWRRAGLSFGVPEAQVPADLASFDRWWADVVDRLEDHPTAHDVLDALRRPKAPSLVPDFLWWPLGEVVGRVVLLVTLGTLPPVLRERLGYEWREKDERRLRALGRVVRVVNRVLPRRARAVNGVLVRRYEKQIRAHAAHGAALGVAPSIAAGGAATVSRAG
ncbi:MAG TPA: oxygenase MpaB family protein [Nocardioidaceae bacterium]|nr:oxygenase MpaB family protein [Nocardioidaceae bacterium]